jgi:hypothetical protein
VRSLEEDKPESDSHRRADRSIAGVGVGDAPGPVRQVDGRDEADESRNHGRGDERNA